MDSYLKFDLQPKLPSRKTKIWLVLNKYDGSELGRVFWYTKWRKYTFEAAADCIFDAGCLKEIADFCLEQIQVHKEGVVVE